MRSQTTAVKMTVAALAISGIFLTTRAFAADITRPSDGRRSACRSIHGHTLGRTF
jgi:hypothetical protein